MLPKQLEHFWVRCLIFEEGILHINVEEYKNNKNKLEKRSKNVVEAAEEAVVETEAERLQKELDNQKDQFLRLAAEYDNYRKRTEKEKLATYENAVAATVEALLPVADNFALAMASSADVSDDFKKGLDMIAKQFQVAFEKLNVETFGERGDKFDPELHNAIARTDDSELEEDCIALVYQKGYKIGDRIIRHAMVQITN